MRIEPVAALVWGKAARSLCLVAGGLGLFCFKRLHVRKPPLRGGHIGQYGTAHLDAALKDVVLTPRVLVWLIFRHRDVWTYTTAERWLPCPELST